MKDESYEEQQERYKNRRAAKGQRQLSKKCPVCDRRKDRHTAQEANECKDKGRYMSN